MKRNNSSSSKKSSPKRDNTKLIAKVLAIFLIAAVIITYSISFVAYLF